jgi:hypothetical protein
VLWRRVLRQSCSLQMPKVSLLFAHSGTALLPPKKNGDPSILRLAKRVNLGRIGATGKSGLSIRPAHHGRRGGGGWELEEGHQRNQGIPGDSRPKPGDCWPSQREIAARCQPSLEFGGCLEALSFHWGQSSVAASRGARAWPPPNRLLRTVPFGSDPDKCSPCIRLQGTLPGCRCA